MTLALTHRIQVTAGMVNETVRWMSQARSPKRADSRTLALSTLCTGFVFVPHSLHAYATVEAYASGFPMLVPTPRLLAEWHNKHQVIQHRDASMILHDDDTDDEGTPHSSNVKQLTGWLSHCEFYHWPSTILFDTEDELLLLLGSVDHAPRPEQQEYMRTAAREAAPRVEYWMRRIQRRCQG